MGSSVRRHLTVMGALALGAASLTAQPVRPAAATATTRAAGTAAARQLDVFIVAHPDDWQLFMGDVAVAAVRAGTPTVFVVVTAGDAGRDARYWLARERGAIASMLVANGTMPADSAQLGGETVSPAECAPLMLAPHRIQRCAYRASRSYFLRMPDGNVNGAGFTATGRTGLEQFESGRATSMLSIDGGVRLDAWAMLGTTLGDVLQGEATRLRVPAARVRLHTQDPDTLLNPNDHSDHRAVGRMVAAMADAHGWALTNYADYSITHRPVNRTAAQFADKASVFMAYDRARILADTAWSAYHESPRLYSSWLSRTYARTVRPASRGAARAPRSAAPSPPSPRP